MLSFGKGQLSLTVDSKVWVENVANKDYKDENEEPYFLVASFLIKG
jgi:hypothetical protein